MSITLESALDELYAAPREDFIARRKDLASALRAAGKKSAADRIEKLTKPTTAAWLANRLARTDPDEVRALVDLGDALRRAHERLDGEALRSLTRQRSRLIDGLLRRIETSDGHTPSETVIRELENVLARAVADVEVAEAWADGRLTSAKAFAPLPVWPSPPAGESLQRPSVPQSAKPERRRDNRAERIRRERAQKVLADARAAVKSAEAERAGDERSLADAEAAADKAATEVNRLQEELATAEKREKRAHGLVAKARQSVREAERRAAQAWRQVQAAEAKLSELREPTDAA
ncbi:MAG: hypothetical protein ACRDQZ_17780 [Mycobacteriales bacterium]